MDFAVKRGAAFGLKVEPALQCILPPYVYLRAKQMTSPPRQTTPKTAGKVKTSLDSAYSYLGGNAFGRDKKGKITKDDASLSSEMAAAGVGFADGNEYMAYVYYEFEFP